MFTILKFLNTRIDIKFDDLMRMQFKYIFIYNVPNRIGKKLFIIEKISPTSHMQEVLSIIQPDCTFCLLNGSLL